MDVAILSLFPDYFLGPFDESILKRARERDLLRIRHVQIRDFAFDKHKKVDDRPFGGGPGMVLKPEPVSRAIHSVKRENSHVVYLSPQGKVLSAKKCRELAEKEHLILLCGHYEGVDERVIAQEVDEEISIGDYVLTNGALAAIVLLDAVARFIPGVIGDEEGVQEDSFEGGLLDCPHFTRPVEFSGMRVPDVLLEGDHAKVAAWRQSAALQKTQTQRPDLYLRYAALHTPAQENDLLSSLEVVLRVQDLKKAVRFYQKTLGLTLLLQEKKRAKLAPGIVLLEGDAKEKIDLRLVIDDRATFCSMIQRLMRENPKLNIISGESEDLFPFSDADGHRWMLVYPNGELTNNGRLN